MGNPEADRDERAASAYLSALCWALFAYSVFGKGFAYLGVPPLYVGEVLLGVGLVVALRTKSFLAALASPSSLVLLGLLAWTASRVAPYLSVYGADAIRDGAVVYYAGFALIAAGLVLSRPERIDFLIKSYAKFALAFPILGLATYAATRFSLPLPVLNSSEVPIVQVRPGEAGVHVAGIAAFAVLGFVRLGTARWIALGCLALMVASANRGAMLAISVSLALAAASTGQVRQSLAAASAGLVLLTSALVFESATANVGRAESSDERRVSATQIVNNFSGIFGTAPDSGEGTKEWRQDWWRRIVDDTVRGPNFWTGRGFGVNLAAIDDVVGWNPDDAPPLRSPHSVHMTMLARGGVPLLALWVSFLCVWFATMVAAAARARRANHAQWHGALLFVVCYVLAILIDASFDVALEGPMVGIWFWCLIGFGAAAATIYRAVEHGPDRACARG